MKAATMAKPFPLKAGGYFFPGIALVAGVIACDQLTKWLVTEKLFAGENAERMIAVFPGLNFIMAWNRGVSFSLFHDLQAPTVLSALALIVSLALSAWLFQARTKTVAAALALIIGGALGNVIDRLRFGAVADFIDVYAGSWHWPTFNLADSAICVGAFLLILDSFLHKETAP